MKKKLLSYAMAFALVIAGLCIPETEPVYAASIKISSVEDLLAMEENPMGSYYLANDITVPKDTCLFSSGRAFSGTLDGKGHALKGYRSTEAPALFEKAKFAEFKNLTMPNVDIKVKGSAAALVLESDSCLFKNISVSGTIVSSGNGGDVGAIAARGNGSMEKCKNSAAITAKTKVTDKSVGGLAGDFDATSLENCSNSGDITLSTGKNTLVVDFNSGRMSLSVSGLTTGESDIVTGCSNSGDITLKLNYKVDVKKSDFSDWGCGISAEASGLCRYAREVSSSGNTGKINVTSGKSALITNGCHVGGLVGQNAYNVAASKCYNTGDVTVSGGFSGDKEGEGGCCFVGGLFGYAGGVRECYNTGNVTVSLQSWHFGGVLYTGGLSGDNAGALNNCYNTGNVKVSNKGKKAEFSTTLGSSTFMVGGLAGRADVLTGKRDENHGVCNYSTGEVAYPSGSDHGVLIGCWQGPFMAGRSMYYDNYYANASGPAYGHGDTSWGPFQPTAKKVSSITSGNCPKLSSKYWTYSSKHRRMILKNNQEK